MSFSFTTRLPLGKNGSRSINSLLELLVSAVSTAISAVEDRLDTVEESLGEGAITASQVDAGAFFQVFATGADASSAAQDLTATGVVAANRIVSVVNWTDGTVLDKSVFTTGAGIISQASSDLTDKKLLFLLLLE